MRVEATFPKKLQCLFKPSRYKVLYGGRGGAKSWGIARALLIMGANKQLRVLCAREFQNSISESVHQLLENQVAALGLQGHYDVQQAKIIGKNGTEFVFAGLRNNINNMKSFEGCNICWVEEAVNVSKRSWDVLIPTIRKDGSEIWVSFNPELETDETYVRYVLHPPPDSIVAKIGWRDNPWFPEVLRREMEHLKATDPVAHSHVWEGNCTQTIDGAVYANELLEVLNSGRRTKVPHDKTKPVSTFWDLGRSDMTAIWFHQKVGYEHRMIDYYETNGHTAEHFVGVLTGSADTGAHRAAYRYETHWLPHDARNKTILHPLSFEGQLRALMPNAKTQVVQNVSVADGIHAARTVMPTVVFDEVMTVDGWQCLTHYQYEIKDGQRSKNPLHNWASHGADAFRYFGVALKEQRPPLKLPTPGARLLEVGRRNTGNTGWMR